MNDGFYKASRAMLARTDVTAAEKLVRIVRAHYRAFEGREPTAAEAARATGLGDRTVRRFLAAKLATAKTAKMPAKMAGKTAKLATPNVVKTSVVRDVDKGGGDGNGPPPPGAQPERKKALTPHSEISPRADLGERMIARAVRPAGAREWKGFVAEAVRRFGEAAVGR